MKALHRVFGLDSRALALFRLALSGNVFYFLFANVGVHGWSVTTGIGLMAAFLMMLGVRTRVFVAITWVAMLLIVPGMDYWPLVTSRFLMALLMVSLFLPMGARYSIDSSLDLRESESPSYFAAGSVVLTLQLYVIFSACFFSVLQHQGSVVNLQIEPGTAVLLIGSLIALLPSALMDALSALARSTHQDGLHIYYDRDCGFCHKICLIFRTFFLLGSTPVTPAQNDDNAFRYMQRHNSWVVRDIDGQLIVRWHAVLLLMRRSLIFRPLGIVLTAVKMGYWCDWLYSAIAATRSMWSRVTAILLPYRSLNMRTGKGTIAILTAWCICLCFYNVSPEFRMFLLMGNYDFLAIGFALDQDWSMLLGTGS